MLEYPICDAGRQLGADDRVRPGEMWLWMGFCDETRLPCGAATIVGGAVMLETAATERLDAEARRRSRSGEFEPARGRRLLERR
jgi:hypothetical protein